MCDLCCLGIWMFMLQCTVFCVQELEIEKDFTWRVTDAELITYITKDIQGQKVTITVDGFENELGSKMETYTVSFALLTL